MTTAGLRSTSAHWLKDAALLDAILPERLVPHCVGAYFFGTDGPTSIINRADPDRPMTIQGAPTYGANSATVRSSAAAGYGFLTGISPDSGHTQILVRKNAVIATQPHVAGFLGQGGGTAFGFYQFGANNYMAAGEGLSVDPASRARPGSGDTVYFEMVTNNYRDPSLARYGAAGVLTNVAAAAAPGTIARMAPDNVNKNFKEIAYGSNLLTDSIDNNAVELFCAFIVNTGFEDAEANATYQALRTLYDTVGVTIV